MLGFGLDNVFRIGFEDARSAAYVTILFTIKPRQMDFVPLTQPFANVSHPASGCAVLCDEHGIEQPILDKFKVVVHMGNVANLKDKSVLLLGLLLLALLARVIAIAIATTHLALANLSICVCLPPPIGLAFAKLLALHSVFAALPASGPSIQNDPRPRFACLPYTNMFFTGEYCPKRFIIFRSRGERSIAHIIAFKTNFAKQQAMARLHLGFPVTNCLLMVEQGNRAGNVAKP